MAVSPDGRELAFVQEGEVRAMAFEGGPVRVLASSGAVLRWQTDGYVYFATPDGDAARVPAAGGTAEIVSALRDGEARRFVVQILPGGRGALLIVQLVNLEMEVHALDLSTGESRRLTPGSPASYFDAGHLVFLTEGALMAAPFDPTDMELLGPAVAIMPRTDLLTFGRSVSVVLPRRIGTMVSTSHPTPSRRARSA
jgi:hypothetical protein